MRSVFKGCAAALMLAALSACQAPLPRQQGAPVAASFDCPVAAGVKAEYVGPYRGLDNDIPAADLARDTYCGEVFKASRYPNGFVTVFGSSRIREANEACLPGGPCDPQLKARYDALYGAVRTFAADWSRRFGQQYPVMAGAGPGLMEAANRGAAEGGGPSIGYTTYYDRSPSPSPQRPYGGDPAKAFNPYVTNGLIFTSVAVREAAMVRHSAAIVIAPGGTGTEWETYQALEMIKSSQLRRIPVYFLGDRTLWSGLEARIQGLVAQRVVAADELRFIRFASAPEALVAALAADLGLQPPPGPPVK
ncbi:hypothetical protein GCM10027034_26650 [Ramlibacter solisilvae]|uniref:LOG family protein n=1 Tax=Ramlibacter tataouinensis TaxID=94132 RepID=UPI000777B33C|nr:LOG family protein [Ramlibacter tataouinensis]